MRISRRFCLPRCQFSQSDANTWHLRDAWLCYIYGHWAAENEIERFFFLLAKPERKEVPLWYVCLHGLWDGNFLLLGPGTLANIITSDPMCLEADRMACTFDAGPSFCVWEPKLIVIIERHQLAYPNTHSSIILLQIYAINVRSVTY